MRFNQQSGMSTIKIIILLGFLLMFFIIGTTFLVGVSDLSNKQMLQGFLGASFVVCIGFEVILLLFSLFRVLILRIKKYPKLTIIVLAVFAAGIAAVAVFNNRPSSAGQAFISPFQLSPYVSHTQARANICRNPTNPIVKKACQKEYDEVAQDDTEKIDALFGILDEAKKDTDISDYDKYLVAQVVFTSLPNGANPAAFNIPATSWLVNFAERFLAQITAGVPKTGISRAEYEKQLLDDLASVRKNCPSPGYENWTLYVSCSEISWVNGKRQPTYSKEYSETGGPCAFSEAGTTEGFDVQSTIETKMKSEYRFSDASGKENQIACAFTCGSYSCPKLEGQIVSPYCDAKDSTTIYIPHFGYKKGLASLPANESRAADESAEAECSLRSNDYALQNNGMTKLVKARDCEINGGASQEWRKDPSNNQAVYYSTYCCSCERPVRDIYRSIGDFTEPGYKGKDLLKNLLDKTKSTEREAASPDKGTITTPPKEIPPKDASEQQAATTTPPLKFTLAQSTFNAKVGERFEYSFCQPAAARSGSLCAASATNPRYGLPPYSFYLEFGVGSLPSGLTLTSNGLLAGTPTAAGSRTVGICAKDTGGFYACQKVTINVEPKEEAYLYDGHYTVNCSSSYRDNCCISGSIDVGLPDSYRETMCI
ncbi:MAG: putative Ig domain-containing protein, partial [Candidatus Pacebacteria bacterium]|nr:putative Ig domain-containing protein [Candidatus Paceibacterota bacterium]